MKSDVKKRDYLSKSLFIRGLQCHKSLYLDRHNPELKDKITTSTEALFESGHEVGRMAQNLFPGGVEIPYEGLSHEEQLQMTQSEIKKGTTTLYEASFSYNGVFVKVDILHKGKQGWEIYEVKSSTDLKDVYDHDAAIQYYVLTGAGLSISKVFLTHINREYVRQGAIDVQKLFTIKNLTNTVKKSQSFIADELRNLREVLGGEIPEIDIGPHCNDPYPCDFIGHCWSHIPENSVFDLKGVRTDKKFFLYKKGIVSMFDVPEEYLSVKQFIQVDAARKENVHYDHKAVKEFINSLWYPMYFLDFETFMQAIPPYDGIRPYQQIPFQYSLHHVEQDGGDLKHYEFLAMPHTDPRKTLIEKLVTEIPDNACVLAYNKSFEIGRLGDLASRFPEYSKKIKKIIHNIRDLIVPFRSYDIYHWKQGGSCSLKAVLPAMLPEFSYEHLSVQDGGMAMDAYAAMNQTDDPVKIKQIRKSLLEYCKLDTLAMVKILERL